MSATVKCWRCEVDGELNSECKGCGLLVSQYAPTKGRKPEALITEVASPSNYSNYQNSVTHVLDSFNGRKLDEVVKNIEKTKFATRAIYKLLLIQLTSTATAAGAYVWGSNQVNTAVCLTTGKQCEPNYWLQFLALISFIVGAWRAQYVANREFEKSE